MSAAKPFTCGDLFIALNRCQLYALGFDSFTVLPGSLIAKRNRITYEFTLAETNTDEHVVRVTYDGNRRRLLVPLSKLTEAMEAICS
jgi:hypothetical protein